MNFVESINSNVGGKALNGLFSQGGASGAMGAIKGGMKPPSVGSVVGMAADTLTNLLPEKTEYSGDKGHITQAMDGVYDTISDGLMSVPGVGMAAGAIMKAGKFVGAGVNALGGGTDGMTTADAILGSSFLNLTPLGMINGFGGKKADTITKDNEAFANSGTSYLGSNANVDNAVSKSGKKYGLVSGSARRKANQLIAEAGRQQGTIKDITEQAGMTREVMSNQGQLEANAANFESSGGYDIGSARAAKHGAKLDILKAKSIIQDVQNIKKAKEGIKFDFIPVIEYNYDFPESVPEFKEGGSIEVSDQPNLIPEGALHKNKHHMENDEDITKKGIPVVVEENDGKLSQQAEIERDEIIINKELTVKLEDLLKEYNKEETSKSRKDELSIEAGKILAVELMTNTNDRTGLMNAI